MTLNWKNLILCLIYTLAFISGYILFLNPFYEYAGYTLPEKIDIKTLLISILISLIPILKHHGIITIASFISIFIYLLLYIPIVLTFGLLQNLSFFSIVEIQLVFMLGMIIIFSADNFVPKFKFYINSETSKYRFILILTILSTFYMLFNYRNNLKFVAFEDVYVQRTANYEFSGGYIIKYLTSWLSHFMIPICLTHGLINKRKLYFIVGTFACLIIYMSTASKLMVLLPFVFLGLYISFYALAWTIFC